VGLAENLITGSPPKNLHEQCVSTDNGGSAESISVASAPAGSDGVAAAPTAAAAAAVISPAASVVTSAPAPEKGETPPMYPATLPPLQGLGCQGQQGLRAARR